MANSEVGQPDGLQKPKSKMAAVVQDRYGAPDVLRVTDVDKPEPGETELLVQVRATTVTATEAVFRRGKPYISRLFTGIARPKLPTLGEEFAGKVVAVGAGVTRFAVGDQVFGTAGPHFGAAAEFVKVSQDDALTLKPDAVSYGEAAASVDGFLTALPFLRDHGNIRPGMQVLINGASGSVGAAAVQIAKQYGAEVTGVSSGANSALLKSLGADHLVDYTSEDFTDRAESYDIIFDTVGKSSFGKCKRALRVGGVFLEAGMSLGVLCSVATSSLFGRKKAKVAATGLRPAGERLKDLTLLAEWLTSGAIVPVVDRTYPLREIVDAHRYVDTGRKRGNVVISLDREADR